MLWWPDLKWKVLSWYRCLLLIGCLWLVSSFVFKNQPNLPGSIFLPWFLTLHWSSVPVQSWSWRCNETVMNLCSFQSSPRVCSYFRSAIACSYRLQSSPSMHWGLSHRFLYLYPNGSEACWPLWRKDLRFISCRVPTWKPWPKTVPLEFLNKHTNTVNSLDYVFKRPRDDALLLLVLFHTLHRMRFSCSCLPVGEDGAVVSLQHTLNDR